MFSVYLQQLMYACEGIHLLAYKQKNRIDEIEKAINTLGFLSGMEEMIRILRETKLKLEEQEQYLLDILQGLEKIIMCYQRAEQRMCDYAECSWQVPNPVFGMEQFNLFDSDIANILIKTSQN